MQVLAPQDWTEVLSPPLDLARQTAELISRSGVLTLDELEQLVCDVVARPELWEPLCVVDPDRRRYRLLYEDDRVDVWVLSWSAGQGTGFHDHDLSGVGLAADFQVEPADPRALARATEPPPTQVADRTGDGSGAGGTASAADPAPGPSRVVGAVSNGHVGQ